MSDRRLRLIAWGLLAVAAALVVMVAGVAAATTFTLDVREAPMLVVALSFAVVGAVVAAGAPRNQIGWLLLAVGLGLAFFGATTALVELGIERPATIPATSTLAWLASNFGLCAFIALMLLLSRLPSGTLPSRRWRGVNVLAAVALVSGLAASFAPGPFDDHPELENPFGIPGFGTVATDLLQPLVVLLLFTVLLVSLASVVVRFRRARGLERQQLKWVAASVGTTVLTWLIAFATSYDDSNSSMWVAWSLTLCFVPVSIGIAVRRYRLYDLDRVVSRALVYGGLSLILGATYVGLVLAGQALFASFAGGSNLAIAASTLLVAGLFLPVRARVQRFVDRRFYRRRYDAERTLEGFAARLREQVDLATLERDLRGVVGETMQPAHTSMWLRGVLQ
jgi:hypothetical protein